MKKNEKVVAMAYVPWQMFNGIYDLDRALCAGTIFPCLDKPFKGRCACNERRK